jgi:hypothetical protein
MRLSKIYENAKDNAAFDRCVDVMARLMLKYGNQVLEQRGEKAPLSLSEQAIKNESSVLEDAA